MSESSFLQLHGQNSETHIFLFLSFLFSRNKPSEKYSFGHSNGLQKFPFLFGQQSFTCFLPDTQEKQVKDKDHLAIMGGGSYDEKVRDDQCEAFRDFLQGNAHL